MIRFTYTPEFRDYWRFHRHFLRGVTGKFRWLALAMVCIYLVFPLWAPSSVADQPLFMMYVNASGLLIIPGMLVLLYVSTFMEARKRWATSSEVRSAKEFEVSEQGIQVRGEGVSGFVEWGHFATVECRDGWYFLKTAQNAFHYFPGGVVPDREALVRLMKNNVRNTRGV